MSYYGSYPAVVTNTTWHTVHEYEGESAFEASAIEICMGETIVFDSTYPLVEDSHWNLDENPVVLIYQIDQ